MTTKKKALLSIIPLCFVWACGNVQMQRAERHETLLSPQKYKEVLEQIRSEIITSVEAIPNEDLTEEERAKLVKIFNDRQQFINGKLFPATASQEDVLAFCVENRIPAHYITKWAAKHKRKDLIEWLIDKGIYVSDDISGEQLTEMGIPITDTTPTYVFSTDQNYIVPTLVAISSLIEKNQGEKKIIVLATDTDTYKELNEEILPRIGLDKVGWNRVKVWNWEDKKNCLFATYKDDFQKAVEDYHKMVGEQLVETNFSTFYRGGIGTYDEQIANKRLGLYSDGQWNYEGIRCRFLFPLLFRGTNIKNFSYLDGDLIVIKDLSCMQKMSKYTLFQTVHKDDGQTVICAQPFISSYVYTTGSFGNGRLVSEDYAVQGEYNIGPHTSGGVVFWNLKSVNSMLTVHDYSLLLVCRKSGLQDEKFLNLLSNFWWNSAEREQPKFLNHCGTDWLNNAWLPLDIHQFRYVDPFFKMNTTFNCIPRDYNDPDVSIIHWDQQKKPWNSIKEVCKKRNLSIDGILSEREILTIDSFTDILDDTPEEMMSAVLWFTKLLDLITNSNDKAYMLEVVKNFFLR